MFRLKYRYFIIIVLAVYSYFNTVFSEVYLYYGIKAPPYIIIAAFLIITLLVWESNRVLQSFAERIFPPESSIKSLAVFFLVGMVVSSGIAVAVVLAANSVFLHLSTDTLKMPLKL